jgi:hypothetical protein
MYTIKCLGKIHYVSFKRIIRKDFILKTCFSQQNQFVIIHTEENMTSPCTCYLWGISSFYPENKCNAPQIFTRLLKLYENIDFYIHLYIVTWTCITHLVYIILDPWIGLLENKDFKRIITRRFKSVITDCINSEKQF